VYNIGYAINKKMPLVATFYHFTRLENYEDMKEPIFNFCKDNNIKGTILLAEEGINSTISGTKEDLKKFFEFLNKDHRLCDIKYKEIESDFIPFQELKVRLKTEIVRLANSELECMNEEEHGRYIDPEKWDELIQDKDVKVIDTRNIYETKVGRFINSIDPKTTNFRDFPEWLDKWIMENKITKSQKVAMYCTGGVRCEKSTAYMKKLGFENVYHLKGGILDYFEKTGNKNKLWEGSCFVFDDRVALDENLKQVELHCTICNNLVTTDDLKDVTKGKVICNICDKKE
jgi:UPF0176 protein